MPCQIASHFRRVLSAFLLWGMLVSCAVADDLAAELRETALQRDISTDEALIQLDRLRPQLKRRVEMRVALHRHPGIKGVVEAAQDILRAVPGVELIDLGQPAVGLMSNYFRALPALRRELQKKELDAAEAAQLDALVAVYHADHRELCAHERDYPFRIMNLLEIVGESMGIRHEDHFKRLKMMQDVDAIAADCEDLIAQHGLDPAATRQAIQAMLEEQPLPLRGGVT